MLRCQPSSSIFGLKGEANLSKKVNNPWKAIGLVSIIGADLAICIIAGVLFGKYLDEWLHTAPWIMIVGLFLGLGVGIVSVYRMIRPYL